MTTNNRKPSGFLFFAQNTYGLKCKYRSNMMLLHYN
nr:MAG TPA: hypothetical protein [Caudoviricetes sp.]